MSCSKSNVSLFLAVEFLNNVAAIRGESGRQVAQWMLAGDHHDHRDDDLDDGYDHHDHHDDDVDDGYDYHDYDADDACTYLYNIVHHQRSHLMRRDHHLDHHDHHLDNHES